MERVNQEIPGACLNKQEAGGKEKEDNYLFQLLGTLSGKTQK